MVLMVLEWYAQSRRTMNSKPSEDMRVTYVEGSVVIVAACLWGGELLITTRRIRARMQSAIDVVFRDFDTNVKYTVPR